MLRRILLAGVVSVAASVLMTACCGMHRHHGCWNECEDECCESVVKKTTTTTTTTTSESSAPEECHWCHGRGRGCWHCH